MRTIALSTCVAAAFMGVAAAQTLPVNSAVRGWTYFNRPGATLAQHRADIEGCFDAVAAMTPPPAPQLYDPVAANPGYYSQTYGAAGGIAGSLMVASAQMQEIRNARNRAMVTNYENCMVVRGWRVVRVSSAVGRRLQGLTQASLEARLEPMIAAEQPEGEIVRSFSIAFSGAPATDSRDGDRSNSLSLLAMPSHSIATEGLRPEGARTALAERSGAERREERERVRAREQRLEQAQARADAMSASGGIAAVTDLSAISSDASLVVVSADGVELTFVRDGAAGAEPASFVVLAPSVKDGPTDQGPLVFAVPPGRWRISHISNGMGAIALCMGAPAFDVGASEVVFAGAFAVMEYAPNMTLSPAAAVLTSVPAFADRLRPAAYVNGNVGDCGSAQLVYAYEIPGAPFAEGYRWGSQGSLTGASAPQ